MPALVTAEEFFVEVGLEAGDSFAQTWLEQAEPIARAVIEEETGRYFGEIQEDVPWILNGSGTRQLVLPDYYVSLTSVEYRSGNAWTELADAADFYVNGFVLISPVCVPLGRSNIRVIVDRGYDDIEEIPVHVRGTARRILARLWATRATAMSSEIIDDIHAGIKKLSKSSDVKMIPRPYMGV